MHQDFARLATPCGGMESLLNAKFIYSHALENSKGQNHMAVSSSCRKVNLKFGQLSKNCLIILESPFREHTVIFALLGGHSA